MLDEKDDKMKNLSATLKTYFKAICIKERLNLQAQARHARAILEVFDREVRLATFSLLPSSCDIKENSFMGVVVHPACVGIFRMYVRPLLFISEVSRSQGLHLSAGHKVIPFILANCARLAIPVVTFTSGIRGWPDIGVHVSSKPYCCGLLITAFAASKPEHIT